MKLGAWANKCKSVLEKLGFNEFKPHEFKRVINDVLFTISFQGKKKDVYIWYAMYPLAMPDIWCAMGYGNSSGRLPEEENTISVRNEDDIDCAQVKLLSIFENELVPILNSVKKASDLSSLLKSDGRPLMEYPRAFCLFQMECYEEAFAALETVNKIEGMSLTDERAHIGALTSLKSADIPSEIEKIMNININKLRLRELV
jgi:hypothetical protein